jgi:DNA-binding ferritin-like protein
VIAKLTDGDIQKCAGKEIDEDGDVYNQKGQVIGHVTLLEDIPEPEPEPEPEPTESPEEIKEREQLEQDKKLAGQLAMCIQQSLDKIQPILKMITEAIEAAERQPKDELDEQKLVDTVRPLIEQGGAILTEANGVIRGLDPDGRIQANAKHKTASREATPEEYRLAEVLKELTTNVTQTIENAKKKIAGMPHAKKELNPLWNLLAGKHLLPLISNLNITNSLQNHSVKSSPPLGCCSAVSWVLSVDSSLGSVSAVCSTTSWEVSVSRAFSKVLDSEWSPSLSLGRRTKK